MSKTFTITLEIEIDGETVYEACEKIKKSLNYCIGIYLPEDTEFVFTDMKEWKVKEQAE